MADIKDRIDTRTFMRSGEDAQEGVWRGIVGHVLRGSGRTAEEATQEDLELARYLADVAGLTPGLAVRRGRAIPGETAEVEATRAEIEAASGTTAQDVA